MWESHLGVLRSHSCGALGTLLLGAEPGLTLCKAASYLLYQLLPSSPWGGGGGLFFERSLYEKLGRDEFKTLPIKLFSSLVIPVYLVNLSHAIFLV